jgi:hypothetical protein
VLSNPPYSPHVVPADSLFPTLKSVMKGTRVQTVSSIQQTGTRELKAIQEEEFSLAFNSLYVPCASCADTTFFAHYVVFYGLNLGTYVSHFVLVLQYLQCSERIFFFV